MKSDFHWLLIAGRRQREMALTRRSRNDHTGIPAKKTEKIQLPTLASIESLAIPLVQEVVILADFRCANCQQRVAEVMARMNGGADSVVVDFFSKRVTLTCKMPIPVKVASRQVTLASRLSLHKVALFRRLFLSSSA